MSTAMAIGRLTTAPRGAARQIARATRSDQEDLAALSTSVEIGARSDARREAARLGPPCALLIDRCEVLTGEHLLRLRGTIRDLRPAR
jgi:hypothetical protein